jgi:hypothetical protein
MIPMPNFPFDRNIRRTFVTSVAPRYWSPDGAESFP